MIIENRSGYHRALLLGLACCFVLLPVSCSPHESEKIRLGLIVQQDTNDGPISIRTVSLAVDAFNEAGGLWFDGESHPVELLVEDPQGRPEEAARIALRMINQQKIFALVGPSRSISAIPVAEIANNAHVPMISPASTNVATTLGKPFAFRVTFTDPVQGPGMARFAREALGATTAAVIYDESVVYSRGLAESFRDSFEEGQGEITIYAGFVRGEWETALAETFETLRRTQPDVLFLPVFQEYLLPQAQKVRDLGIESTLLGGDSWPVADLVSRPAFDEAYAVVPWHFSAGADNPRVQDLLEAYREEWHEPLIYVTPVLAYEAASLLLEALKQAGRPDPEKVRQALANLTDYPGVTGDISYRGTHGDPTQQGVVIHIQGGRAQFVERLASADASSERIEE